MSKAVNMRPSQHGQPNFFIDFAPIATENSELMASKTDNNLNSSLEKITENTLLNISTEAPPLTNKHLFGGGTGTAQHPLHWRPIGIKIKQNITLTTSTTPIDAKINATFGSFINSTFKDIEKVFGITPFPKNITEEDFLVPDSPNMNKSRVFTEMKQLKEDSKFELNETQIEQNCLEENEPMQLYDLSIGISSAVRSCFRRIRNCRLDAKPLDRRLDFNEEQCINFCGRHNYCSSIIYSKSKRMCDIFNTRNGTMQAKLAYNLDYQYYETRNATKSVVPCWLENSPEQMPESARIPEPLLIDSNETNSNSTQNDAELNLGTGLVSKNPKDMCPGDKDILVFKSSGYRLKLLSDSLKNGSNNELTKNVSFQQTSSETECIFSCLINLAQGKIPYECVASTYTSATQQCYLYGQGNDLDGNVHLIPDSQFNHYEKVDLVELCKGYPVVRHPQKTLLGFAIGSRKASTFIECIEFCFAQRQKFNTITGVDTTTSSSTFNGAQQMCKSVMYFYEEDESSGNNCILNSESKETAPDFFVDENEALVDYASFENCYNIEEPEQFTSLQLENEEKSKTINLPNTELKAALPPIITLEPIEDLQSDELGQQTDNAGFGTDVPSNPRRSPIHAVLNHKNNDFSTKKIYSTDSPQLKKPMKGVLAGLLHANMEQKANYKQRGEGVMKDLGVILPLKHVQTSESLDHKRYKPTSNIFTIVSALDLHKKKLNSIKTSKPV